MQVSQTTLDRRCRKQKRLKPPTQMQMQVQQALGHGQSHLQRWPGVRGGVGSGTVREAWHSRGCRSGSCQEAQSRLHCEQPRLQRLRLSLSLERLQLGGGGAAAAAAGDDGGTAAVQTPVRARGPQTQAGHSARWRRQLRPWDDACLRTAGGHQAQGRVTRGHDPTSAGAGSGVSCVHGQTVEAQRQEELRSEGVLGAPRPSSRPSQPGSRLEQS